MAINIVNLMPHTLTILKDGQKIEIPSSGVARVATKPGVQFVDEPLLWTGTEFGQVEGLPDPEGDNVYVVSVLVAAKVGGTRYDVFSPGTGPNDGAIRENGQIVAVTRLVRSC